MSHDEGNPFNKATGEYLQEETSKPDITSDLNSTPPEKADELAEKAKAEDIFVGEPNAGGHVGQVVLDPDKPVKVSKRTSNKKN